MEDRINTFSFESYEEQLSHLSSTAGLHLFSMTAGRATFFSEFARWRAPSENQTNPYTDCSAYVLPDPGHGMSFPNANDVLSAIVGLYMESTSIEKHVASLLDEFGLDSSKASQPIISLSGGELLLLSYAKAKALFPLADKLIACSPVHWLNERRYPYWESLVSHYEKEGKNVDILILKGERCPNINSETGNVCKMDFPKDDIRWKLTLKKPKITFPALTFPVEHPEFDLTYESNIEKFNLTSPTLIEGDNGVGKSIFAKILTGILSTSSGSASIQSINGRSGVRMLSQDTINQLFGKSIDEHLNWVFKYDEQKRDDAVNIYTDMDKRLRTCMGSKYFDSLEALGSTEQKTTLLQAKLGLIAERIASRPPLLILDEPGWGLSASVTRCFLCETLRQAHANNIPIAIISHHTEAWIPVVKSRLSLSRNGSSIVSIEVFNEPH